MMAKLLNEENNPDQDRSCKTKEDFADHIRVGEVNEALENMKKHKAPTMSGVVTDKLQTTRHYITLHYITVFSAGPTTTRTGPAIQVSTIILKTKTMNVKS